MVRTVDVRDWDISLAALEAFGDTAAAAVEWAYRQLTPAQAVVLTEIWEFCDQLEA